jgi:putative nucleotidyltransferase with HDIG domain
MTLSGWVKRRAANVVIGIILTLGVCLVIWSVTNWESADPRRFVAYLMIACLASGIKVLVPGVNTTMASHFLFVLIGIVELSRPETVLMACAASLVQTFWHAVDRPKGIHVAFNVASMGLAAAATFDACRRNWVDNTTLEMPVLLLLAAAVFFLVNTVQVAIVSALIDGKSIWKVWKEDHFWSFPAYLVGAAVASLIDISSKYVGWQSSLLLLPVLYLVYNSHKLHLDKLNEAKLLAEKEKQHSEEMSAIHLRTIETLALAIEAKDGITHDHLERVQVYAVEVAKELGLGEPELEAIRAASILHDIGKLAVPEYIISKPGKLTQAEFDKMKIHPVVGAQILEQVKFPYPVAPIVRSHHERWDGAGYPDGLYGEQIPIGARILAVVDCLDALASDRQYRRALPLEEAMSVVARDAGRRFDPKIIEILKRRFVELEQLARRSCVAEERPKLQTDLRIERGAAPAAGFASEEETTGDLERLSESIYGIETFSGLAKNLQVTIGYDAFAVFVERNELLTPIFTHGPSAGLVARLHVPVGQGVVGWVAKNHKPIINGNPTVEPGFAQNAGTNPILHSVLAVPVESPIDPPVVVCVYKCQRDAFHREHLRLLETLSGSNLPVPIRSTGGMPRAAAM